MTIQIKELCCDWCEKVKRITEGQEAWVLDNWVFCSLKCVKKKVEWLIPIWEKNNKFKGIGAKIYHSPPKKKKK